MKAIAILLLLSATCFAQPGIDGWGPPAQQRAQEIIYVDCWGGQCQPHYQPQQWFPPSRPQKVPPVVGGPSTPKFSPRLPEPRQEVAPDGPGEPGCAPSPDAGAPRPIDEGERSLLKEQQISINNISAQLNKLSLKIESIQGTPGPKGDKGDAGPQGPQGNAGKDAQLNIDELAAAVAAKLPPVRVEWKTLDGEILKQEKRLGEPLKFESVKVGVK